MTPTPPQEQTEREAFEAWIRTQPRHEGANLRFLALNNAYIDFDVHGSWQAWQARASMQAQAPEEAALQRAVEELRANAERYEVVRKLNPRQFADLWERNINGGPQFDALIDELASRKEGNQ